MTEPTDIIWRAPTELFSYVTIGEQSFEGYMADLRERRAAAYSEYMEAASLGAPAETLAALKEHVARHDQAEERQVEKARARIIEGARDQHFIGFGYVDVSEKRYLVRPHWWHFLTLAFDTRIATGEGYRFYGVSFVVPDEAPTWFLKELHRALKSPPRGHEETDASSQVEVPPQPASDSSGDIADPSSRDHREAQLLRNRLQRWLEDTARGSKAAGWKRGDFLEGARREFGSISENLFGETWKVADLPASYRAPGRRKI